MSRHAHVALWIAGIVVALVAAPLAPTALEARTQVLFARIDVHVAAAARARAEAVTSGWEGEPHTGRNADARLVRRGAGLPVPRWPAAWRIVVLRLALLAGAGGACLPFAVAGAIDGLAMRRARRSRLAAVSPLAVATGSHALIALAFVLP